MSENFTTPASFLEGKAEPHGFIDPYSDFGFKHIFGREPNRDFLIRFLNEIFKNRKVIVDIQYNKNEYKGPGKDYRKTIFDLYCTGDKGEKFIIEMQNAKAINFKERSIFYTSNLINEQGLGVLADWEYVLPEIYFVAIMNFKFDDSHPDHYIHDVRLIDIKTQEDFYPKLAYIFIEMPKFKKYAGELSTELDEWLYILNNLNKNEEIPLSLRNKAEYKKLFEIAAIGNLTREEMNEYEQSLKIQRDNLSTLSCAKKEGRDEGKIEGLVEGRIEGRDEANKKTAITLKKNNIDIALIAEATGLTIEEINALP